MCVRACARARVCAPACVCACVYGLRGFAWSSSVWMLRQTEGDVRARAAALRSSAHREHVRERLVRQVCVDERHDHASLRTPSVRGHQRDGCAAWDPQSPGALSQAGPPPCRGIGASGTGASGIGGTSQPRIITLRGSPLWRSCVTRRLVGRIVAWSMRCCSSHLGKPQPRCDVAAHAQTISYFIAACCDLASCRLAHRHIGARTGRDGAGRRAGGYSGRLSIIRATIGRLLSPGCTHRAQYSMANASWCDAP